MNFKELQDCIRLCRTANITLFVWGQHGIGKSSAVFEVGKQDVLAVQPMYLSQVEASELRGLMAKDDVNRRADYYPPSSLPYGGVPNAKATADTPTCAYDEGILFLDELNRAPDDVLQAVFQLVLYGRVGEYKLPAGWSIVCAGNFDSNRSGSKDQHLYILNNFNDSALMDRLCHVTLTCDDDLMEEWVEYMRATHGEHASKIIEFASQDMSHLYGPMCSHNRGFKVTPSPRSWDAVARALKAVQEVDYPEKIKMYVLAGMIGDELAKKYLHYSCPVSPKDILTKGVPTELMADLTRGQIIGLTWGLISHAKEKVGQTTIADRCLDYAEYMLTHRSEERDIVVMFLRKLAASKDKRLKVGNVDLAQASLHNTQLKGILPKQRGFLAQLDQRPVLRDLVAKVAIGEE